MVEPGLGGRVSIVILSTDQKVPGRWEIVCPLGSLHNHLFGLVDKVKTKLPQTPGNFFQ